MDKPRLLIVDDDEEIRTQLKWALCTEYEIVLAEDREAGLAAFARHQPPVVILDLGLPPSPNEITEGMATLSGILAQDPSTKVIIASGQGEKENAMRAVGAGAYDFLTKPVDLEELKLLLRRCFYVSGLEREFHALQQNLQPESFEGILGSSAQMQGVFSFIRKVAPTTAPVLILGESGTGKEMVANAIHRRSPRKAARFVAINCNAIPENLLESELFGHEKGAFTGAHQDREGLIATARGGTLFLDEIGELPAQIQVKLLRFLQEQRFQRVGGRQEIPADTRIIAATHADLKEGIKTGRFREDLYFRLAVVVIRLPALRDRGDDVTLLAREFLQMFATQNSRKGMSYTPDALRAINRHTWPGNVREMQNRVRRSVIMADRKRLTADDLELNDPDTELPMMTLKEARESVEREMIEQALKRHLGKISGAAQDLGISRPTMYELMEKLGIKRGAVSSEQ